jgi:SAM-dependent methyltransferase
MARDIALLPRDQLVKTSELDQADWNFRPGVGLVQRSRFRLVVRELGTRRYEHLLEVGYGSGVFAPELARHCDHLSGVDVHGFPAEVQRVLAENGVQADLRQAGVEELPFPNEAFDAVVVISTLEFVDDLDAACAELRRVLAPRGRLVVVTPGYSKVLDTGLRLLTGERAEDTFHGRRQKVIPTLLRHFDVVARRPFPSRALWAYTALSLTRPLA